MAVVSGKPLPGAGLEIPMISDERTQEVAAILLERNVLSNPVAATKRQLGQLMVCRESAAPSHREHLPVKAAVPLKWQLWAALKVKMPILDWLPKLNRQKVFRDVIAGGTVGVIAIPQGMSYASVAGLPFVYGLYATCIPALVYGFFGQSRQLCVGPVALVSLVVQSGLLEVMTQEECPEWYKTGKAKGKLQSKMCPDVYVELATLTAFTCGVILIIAYIFQLGFFISFLSKPVVSGYTAGAAVIIMLSQCKAIFDFDIPQSQLIQENLNSIFSQLKITNGNTLGLGVAWIVFLQGCRFIGKRWKRFALVGALAPFTACVLGVILLRIWPVLTDAKHHVTYVGTLPQGAMPCMAGRWHQGQLGRILPTAVTCCYVGYIEAISIGKAMAAKHHYYVEPSQELLTLGLCNLIGGLFACYPITGSFSRSAVKLDLNALTQFSSLMTAVVLWAAILFLTTFFFWLPKFVLAAIVISAVLPLVNLFEAYGLYKVRRLDGFLWLVAFACVIFCGVEIGIGIAVAVSLALVVYESVRPQLTVMWRLPGTTIYRSVKQEGSGYFVEGVLILRLGASIYFANAQHIKDTLEQYVDDLERTDRTQYLVLEMTPVISLDASGADVLKAVVREFRYRGIELAFAMVGNRVAKTLRQAGLEDMIGKEWFFGTVHEAVLHCVRHRHLKNQPKAIEQDPEQAAPDQAPDQAPDTPPASEAPSSVHVVVASEVGVSNDFDRKCTALFVSLPADRPPILWELAEAFRKQQLSVVRAQIETGEAGGADGAAAAAVKHVYFLQQLDGAKLTDEQAALLRAGIVAILKGEAAPEYAEIQV